MAAGSTVPDNLNYLSNISFRLTMQDAPNLTWFCQAINVPGVSIEGIDVFTPYVTMPFAGNKVNFEELSVRFIVDEHMKNWIEIYDRIIALGLAEGGGVVHLQGLSVAAGTHSMVVGAGGTGGSSHSDGSNSAAFSSTAYGGVPF